MSVQQSEGSLTPAPSLPPGEFADFYRQEFSRAVQLAWLLTHGHNSEDLAQDAFISVQIKYRQLDNPSAYLTTAVVNRCRTWHRQQQRRRQQLSVVPPQSASRDPVDDYLLDAIGALPYRQRVVVIGRYWADLSEVDIARILGCRPGTVKSLASRALVRLRKEVER